MIRRTRSALPALATLLVLALLAGVATLVVAGEGKSPKETFRARVVNVGGNLPSGTGLMWMTVESWSTDQEREALLRGLQAGGTEGLTKAMRKMDKGYVRFQETLRWKINHAVSLDTPEGRKVRLVTERPITFVETSASLRSQDYTVGVIEFTLPPDGKPGAGVLIPAAKVSINETAKSIEIETPPGNTAPMQLTSVELYKKK
ncbi:MAG: hypothetical protein MUC67_04640 [Acidobacteria bacterium]|nr:hypothetical protein [Acidobacteriota bacterium]